MRNLHAAIRGSAGCDSRGNSGETRPRAWMVAYPLYLFATTVPGPSHIRYLALVGVVPFAATERPGRSVRRWAGLVVVAVAGTLAQVLWIRYFWRLVGTTP